MLSFLSYSRVFYAKLADNDIIHLRNIRKWVICQWPSKITSTHWWYRDLPVEIKHGFLNVAMSESILKTFSRGYCIDILDDMNEVYVSPPTNIVKNTSDEVFYTKHIDGPLYLFPFASCYRLIVGMDDNCEIATVLDMEDRKITLKEGDVLGFDFHRECHHIEKNEGAVNKCFRVVLKIHYCIYPNIMGVRTCGKLLGKLSIMYDKAFRRLFLYTMVPRTVWQRFMGWNVVLWTKIYYALEAHIGYYNLVYLGLLWFFANRDVWLVGTSFVHYMKICMLYNAKNEKLSIGHVLRDIGLYKIISDANVLYLCGICGKRMDFQSIFMTMLGYIITYGYVLENGLKRLYMNRMDYDTKLIIQNVFLHSILAYTGLFTSIENEKYYVIPLHIILNAGLLMI
jgi:hypothetical protein